MKYGTVDKKSRKEPEFDALNFKLNKSISTGSALNINGLKCHYKYRVFGLRFVLKK